MFDTMTITKVLGAGAGSLLVFLLVSWAAETVYHGVEGGEAELAQAYVIDTGADEPPPEGGDAAPAEDFALVLASADPAAGDKVFAKCKACHQVNGANGVGPALNGVVNRPIAAIAGYAYSETLAGMASDAWTPENLNAFLQNPKGYAPGTKMSFAGLPKVEDRANVIAWLQTTN